ncbi:hypothetical protein QUA56_09035 [Microcoleus sp. N3A4]|uniref:hypothetical protein n=1 Tax=Microcoleus sp. N3A4 TaxID=3055379 RepID=UPI002FCEF532
MVTIACPIVACASSDRTPSNSRWFTFLLNLFIVGFPFQFELFADAKKLLALNRLTFEKIVAGGTRHREHLSFAKSIFFIIVRA